MLKQEQTRLLKGLLNHLDAKTNVDAGGIIKAPAETYTSKERFDLEWDSFFQDYPQDHYSLQSAFCHAHFVGNPS